MDTTAGRFRTDKRLLSEILVGIALIALSVPSVCAGSQVEGLDDSLTLSSSAPVASRFSSFEFREYAGLPGLVTAVCREAEQFFHNFYGPTVVTVQPFVFLTGSGEKKLSPMGATLADQMVAMINDQKGGGPPGATESAGPASQQLNGVLLEMGGYLRIHMQGVNGFNRHRSYTANIEMSEALYRSLYADSF